MKKLSIIAVLLVAVFCLSFNNANATSGACSYHGGVDCSGSYERNVICNDGWTGSSVKYSDVEECRYYDPCPSTHVSGLSCTNESDYTRTEKEVMAQRSTQRAIYSRRGLLGSAMDNSSTIGQDELDFCRKSIDLYNRMVESRKKCFADLEKEREVEAKNISDKNKAEVDSNCSNKNGAGSTWNGYVCSPTKEERDLKCKNNDRNSFYAVILNKCLCSSGYKSGINGKCENKTSSSENTIDKVIPEGSLIKAYGDNDIYIIKYVGNKRFKRLILSPSVFNNYEHLKWSDVKEADQGIIDLFTTSNLVRAVGDDKVYLLSPQGDSGNKRQLRDSSIFSKMNMDPDSVYEINSFDRDSYITGELLN